MAEDGRVVLGGDAAGTSGWSLTIRSDEKVWRADDGWVYGFTTSFRMGQLIRYRFARPPADDHDRAEGLMAYLVGPFVDALRRLLKDGGYSKVENNREEGGAFLVGTPTGRLFVVESDFQVGEPAGGIAAVGCGADIALGALHAAGPHLQPRPRVRAALTAAERFSAGVRGPFTIVATDGGDS